jgi:large subunit ribosomal protein L35
MPKLKSHKGLLKRIRATPSGKFKYPRAGGRHKRSHKAADLLRSYRQPNVSPPAEVRRLRSMMGLPVVRRRRRTEPTSPE